MSDPEATPTTRLVLVRHGEAQSAVDRIIGGHKACTGLSSRGRRQVEALRDRWAASGEVRDASALYASALPRAIETAEVLAPAVGAGDLEVRSDCDLCEVHVGEELDGLGVDEAGAHWRALDNSLFESIGPGNESWAEFVVRVGRRLLRLAEDHAGETVVVAGHGGVVDASFRALGGLAIQHRLNTDVANAAITEWVGGGATWRLARYNDAAHLIGVDA